MPPIILHPPRLLLAFLALNLLTLPTAAAVSSSSHRSRSSSNASPGHDANHFHPPSSPYYRDANRPGFTPRLNPLLMAMYSHKHNQKELWMRKDRKKGLKEGKRKEEEVWGRGRKRVARVVRTSKVNKNEKRRTRKKEGREERQKREDKEREERKKKGGSRVKI